MEKLSPEQREEVRKIVREEIKKANMQSMSASMNLELFIKFLDLLRLTISKFQPSKTAIIAVDHINMESINW